MPAAAGSLNFIRFTDFGKLGFREWTGDGLGELSLGNLSILFQKLQNQPAAIAGALGVLNGE